MDKVQTSVTRLTASLFYLGVFAILYFVFHLSFEVSWGLALLNLIADRLTTISRQLDE